jgi:hypothetical protein
MTGARYALLGAAFAATLLATDAAMAATGGAATARSTGGLALLVPVIGALFGWGKIKEKDVTEQFGEIEELARDIALTAPAPPAIPDVRAEPVQLDVEKASALLVRLPPVDFEPALAELPVLTPRDWSPRTGNQDAPFAKPGEMSYLELAGVDAKEAFELLDQLADVLKRS